MAKKNILDIMGLSAEREAMDMAHAGIMESKKALQAEVKKMERQALLKDYEQVYTGDFFADAPAEDPATDAKINRMKARLKKSALCDRNYRAVALEFFNALIPAMNDQEAKLNADIAEAKENYDRTVAEAKARYDKAVAAKKDFKKAMAEEVLAKFDNANTCGGSIEGTEPEFYAYGFSGPYYTLDQVRALRSAAEDLEAEYNYHASGQYAEDMERQAAERQARGNWRETSGSNAPYAGVIGPGGAQSGSTGNALKSLIGNMFK